MDNRHLVDPDSAPVLDIFPRADLDAAPIADIRARASKTYALLPPPVITPEAVVIPSIHGGPDISLFLSRPAETRPGSGAILHIHGGGLVVGRPEERRVGQGCDSTCRIRG